VIERPKGSVNVFIRRFLSRYSWLNSNSVSLHLSVIVARFAGDAVQGSHSGEPHAHAQDLPGTKVVMELGRYCEVSLKVFHSQSPFQFLPVSTGIREAATFPSLPWPFHLF
jgi:hypothetical protein